MERAIEEFGAKAVPLAEIYSAEADVFAPCAIGGILNARTIPQLKADIVAGGANNQLATAEDGAALHARGILYAPDFVANGGGIINVATEIQKIKDREGFVAEKLQALDETMPATAFAASPKDTGSLIQIVGGAPLIVKLLESTQGKGVVLAETKKAAESVITAFRGLKANFLVQQFVKEAAGEDIRCLVVGSKVVASMKRSGADGDFRSNLHLGGSAEAVRITKEERATAVRAAKAFGLNVAGVDLLRSETGPKVLEVNSSPGLEGIEKTSAKNIAALIYIEIENRVRPAPVRRLKPAAT